VTTKPENWEKLKDVDYRHALAMAQFKRFVPFQISSLRKQRGWSQQELAERSGQTQGVISKAEDPDNGNLTVNTVLRIANGFDLVFVGAFVPYSEFDCWRSNLSEDSIVPGFEEEDKKFGSSFLAARRLNLHQTENEPRLVVALPENQAPNKVLNIEDYTKERSQKQSGPFAAAAAAGGR
jgi:transcriptional regulator with XRE-family HTH domain